MWKGVGGGPGVEWDRSGIGTEELKVKRRKEEGGKGDGMEGGCVEGMWPV